MKIYVWAIIAFLVLVLFVGLFFLYGNIMKKRHIEKHYIFKPFKKNDSYGYAMENEGNKIVFYAIKKENGDNNSTLYKFTNCKSKRTSTHRVGAIRKNEKAPNFSKKSFSYDNKDIWKYLEENGIFLETTIVDDNLTQYKISMNSKPIAFARKRKDSSAKYSMRTYENRVDLLFLTLFAIAKTEKQGKELTNKN